MECQNALLLSAIIHWKNNKKGSIGKPLENAEIRFENGEILVKGSSVMKGYYQMPDETAETLKDGWLHTGDKGYMDEDGYLFINGRVKNLIILSNGENVSPEEIENKLALNPLIGEVIVTGEDNGLTPASIRSRLLWKRKHWMQRQFRHSFRHFWMNITEISPPIAALQDWLSAKIRLSATQQKKSGDRMS